MLRKIPFIVFLLILIPMLACAQNPDEDEKVRGFVYDVDYHQDLNFVQVGVRVNANTMAFLPAIRGFRQQPRFRPCLISKLKSPSIRIGIFNQSKWRVVRLFPKWIHCTP